MRLRPCRSLCEAARQNCSQVFKDNSKFTWPIFLDCSQDTFVSDGTTCFGEIQDVTDDDATDSESESPTSGGSIVVTTVCLHFVSYINYNHYTLITPYYSYSET